MSRTRKLFAATAVAVGSSTAVLLSGVATADPVSPPLPIQQLPGLPAVQQLGPVIQQAAANPESAASMLMAAAAAFTGNAAAPDNSKQVATTVSRFVQDPVAPAPNPGAFIPQTQVSNLPATLPGTGIPLPNGVSLPGDLTQLLPAGLNVPGLIGAPASGPAHVPAAGATPGAEAHLPQGLDPANAVGPAPEAEPLEAAPPAAPAAAPVAAPAPAPAPAPGGAPAAGATPAFGPDAPPVQDFMYPSIGTGCLADGGNSIATAISVAGPAKIPTPGPGPAQTAYVFTAVGTPGPAEVQKLPLNVTWVNLSTGKSGSVTLKTNPQINPNGPTTLTAIADTGSGSIMSTIFGQVTTTEKQCQFMPTIGSTVVP